MRKAFSVVVAALLLATGALAESGGSSYSLFGLGDIRYSPNARSAGMGYTGLALPTSSFINNVTPAAWSRIAQSRLEASLLYEGISSSDGQSSRYVSNGAFNGALLAIPIKPSSGIVFVGGFTPFSNVSYDLVTTGSQQGVDYRLRHQGTGGLGKAQVGFSYAPADPLSFGASFNYVFGKTEHATQFVPSSTSLANSTSREDISMHAITVTLGGVFTGLGGISESLRPFSLGFVATTRGNLKTSRETYFEFNNERDTSTTVRGRMTLPFAYGVGLGYQHSERLIFAADYYTELWGNTDFAGSTPSEIRNSQRFGVGAERLRNTDPGAPWTDRLSYRMGFYYSATYYRINGVGVNEWGITGGLDLPLSGESRINLNVEYGRRGTLRNSLVKDNIIRVSASLNINELWFQRFDEE